MKKFLSISLAAAIGATSLATAIPAASAQPAGFQKQYVQEAGWRDRRSHWRGRDHRRGRHHRHRDRDWGAAAAGTIFGLTLGAIANQRHYGYSSGSAHVDWCLRHYPNTYNPRTNLYYYAPGRQRYCDSPYG